MRALVTGAGGFVGGYLVRELDGAGYDILATDIVEPAAGSGVGAFPERIDFRRLDLGDFHEVREAVSDYSPEAVFHLAAQSSAARSFEDPRGTLETNVFGTLNLLEAVRDTMGEETVRFLSVGSCEEYGNRGSDEMPLTERSPVEPVSPYAVSKAAQSMLAIQYHAAYGIECMVARSFSHTGPGQTTRFVLPAFAKQCAEIKAGRREPLIRVGNLDVTRDFLDVRDVVRAYRFIAEKGRAGEIYNVCRGGGLSLREALEAFEGFAGRAIEREVDPGLLRPVDVAVLIGDCGKLRKETGWAHTISIDRMLADLFGYWEGSIEGAG